MITEYLVDLTGRTARKRVCRAMKSLWQWCPIQEFLEKLPGVNWNHRVSAKDVDRRFMNLEREATLVLSYLRVTWKSFPM